MRTDTEPKHAGKRIVGIGRNMGTSGIRYGFSGYFCDPFKFLSCFRSYLTEFTCLSDVPGSIYLGYSCP